MPVKASTAEYCSARARRRRRTCSDSSCVHTSRDRCWTQHGVVDAIGVMTLTTLKVFAVVVHPLAPNLVSCARRQRRFFMHGGRRGRGRMVRAHSFCSWVLVLTSSASPLSLSPHLPSCSALVVDVLS